MLNKERIAHIVAELGCRAYFRTTEHHSARAIELYTNAVYARMQGTMRRIGDLRVVEAMSEDELRAHIAAKCAQRGKAIHG